MLSTARATDILVRVVRVVMYSSHCSTQPPTVVLSLCMIDAYMITPHSS